MGFAKGQGKGGTRKLRGGAGCSAAVTKKKGVSGGGELVVKGGVRNRKLPAAPATKTEQKGEERERKGGGKSAFSKKERLDTGRPSPGSRHKSEKMGGGGKGQHGKTA